MDLQRISGLLRKLSPRQEKVIRLFSEANAQVAQSLYQQAISGKNTAATIFWLKTRAGWRESPAIEPRPVEIPPLIIQVYDEAA
jgi:hypothetical protein